MKIKIKAFSSYILIALFSISTSCAFAEDFFVGKYISESRENFGADEYGKYTIHITKKENGYMLSYTKGDQPLFTVDVHRCSEASLKIQYYHSYALPGEVQALCGNLQSVQFFYAQNGIKIPERAPVKGAIYKTQYYANVQWAVYGFKRIE